MHGIIVLNDVAADVGAGFTPDANTINGVSQTNAHNIGAGASPAPTVPTKATISAITGAYKSLVSKDCLDIYKSKNEMMGKLWQRNYYEHIIRNEQAYENISNYIINNPAKWAEDKFYN